MLESYRAHVEERAALGIPPLPLSAEQINDFCELLKYSFFVKSPNCSFSRFSKIGSLALELLRDVGAKYYLLFPRDNLPGHREQLIRTHNALSTSRFVTL